MTSVTGTVTNGDSALTSGTLTFHPDKEKGNEAQSTPSALIGSDGKYELYTDEKKGAPDGWYKVTVFAEEPRAQDGEEGADAYGDSISLVAQQYTTLEDTPLSVEVKAGGDFDLKLTE